MKPVEGYVLPAQDRFTLQGKHGKGVLIVARLDDEKSELAFLAKIIGAVKMDMEADVLMAKLTKNAYASLAALCNSYPSRAVLLFGIAPTEVGLHLVMQPYQLLRWNGMAILWADTPAALMTDKAKKAALWAALQRLFLA